MPAKPDFSEMHCSIARSLDIIGESWSLLILRDIFQGLRRFDELQKSLGIATNVLTARLKRLTDEGLLEQRLYQEHPARYEYIPTEQGRDLGPILVNLVQWGNKYLAGSKGPPQAIVHNACGHVMSARLTCSHCGEPIGKQGVSIVPTSKVKAVTAALRKQGP
jgi:DNA-binding HxlR family transcriptional regulator